MWHILDMVCHESSKAFSVVEETCSDLEENDLQGFPNKKTAILKSLT
jgi:hypothetical protein